MIMKNIAVTLIVFLYASCSFSQLNMVYKSHVEYNESLNDVWGYAAPDNREYAIVGLRGGVSIVDVTDAENPVIKGYADGPNSTWRDIKTWGEYAYVTNETGGGLLVIDLSNLPADLTENDYFYWEPNIPELSGTLSAAHNIYIDEFGFAILSGANLNEGGLIFIDVTDPGNPQYAGAGAAVYSHDVYARDNVAYSSEIYLGHFAMYDISDKSNISLIATQNTASNWTHNAWLNDVGNILFTTDERPNAPIGAYDISDPGNIETLDQFRPLETLGEGVIPHNVHVWNDWLIISYYIDGCIIVDGSRPENLIEVGNFDTYIDSNTGFRGAWGAYPFLPSQTVLVSDIDNGLYILEPNYVRACWLEGNVTDAESDDPILNVQIEINSSQLNGANTNAQGNYATGQAIAGTFEVTFQHPAYETLVADATLENGEVTILNVQMTKLPNQPVSGSVVSENDGSPVPFAPVHFIGEILEYHTETDANGDFSLQSVLEDDYIIYAGAWGFVNDSIISTIEGSPANLTIELKEGYADDFILDLGWTITSTANTGIWERVKPKAFFYNNAPATPGADLPDDVGFKCYVTGNSGTVVTEDDVDNGFTLLTSPPMDLTDYIAPVVRYSAWFFNDGNGTPNDALQIRVNNGITEVVLETITQSVGQWNTPSEIALNEFIDITGNMTISFYTSDQVNDSEGHIVEAAIDGFSVYDASPVSLSDFSDDLSLLAFPNPFENEFSIIYSLNEFDTNATFLKIYTAIGQQIKSIKIEKAKGLLNINDLPSTGMYFLQIETRGKRSMVVKVVRM